ncbi:MAG: ABC-type transport auxiliary lipoprotein family protein [Novosphingobium sp.]
MGFRDFRKLAALAALALLAGCVSLAGKPPKQLIGLTSDAMAPAGALPDGRLGETLIVLDPQTERRLDVQRVAVQVSDTDIAYVQGVAWVERPARLFRHLLAETIRARGKHLVLEANDSSPGGNLSLSGRLVDMGYDARSRSAVVRFDAMRVNARGVIEARRFEAVVAGVAPDGDSIAPALNRAANRVASEVADWVG